MLAQESARQAHGDQVPRDLSVYAEWREDATPALFEVLEIYRKHLVGQFVGMGETLSLLSIRTAMEIEGQPPETWSEMAHMLRVAHATLMAIIPRKKPKS